MVKNEKFKGSGIRSKVSDLQSMPSDPFCDQFFQICTPLNTWSHCETSAAICFRYSENQRHIVTINDWWHQNGKKHDKREDKKKNDKIP